MARTRFGPFLPPGTPQINRSHPLAQGLVHLWLPGATSADLAGNFPLTTPGTPGPSALGLGLASTVHAGYAATTAKFPLYGAYSVAALVLPSAAPQSGFIRIAEAYYAQYFYLGLNSAGTAYEWITANSALGSCTGGTVAAGVPAALVGTYSGLIETLYVNGAKVNSVTGTAPTVTQNVAIGTTNTSVGSSGFAGSILYVAMWNRVLSPAEIALLHADPYGHLVFPGDRAAGILASPGGGGAVVTVDFALLAEFSGGFVADRGAPIEVLAGTYAQPGTKIEASTTARSDAKAAAELDVAVARDIGSVAEVAAGLRADPALQLEIAATARRDGKMAAEWSGGVLVTGDAAAPFEWAASAGGGVRLPVEFIALLLSETKAGVEWLLTGRAGAELMAEGLAALLGDPGASLEWLTSGSTMLAEAMLPLEWQGSAPAVLLSLVSGPGRIRLLATPGRVRLLRRN